MPVNIQNVLVCDAVDESCIQLLKQNGIKVIYSLIAWDLFVVASSNTHTKTCFPLDSLKALGFFLFLHAYTIFTKKKKWFNKSTGFFNSKKQFWVQNLKCSRMRFFSTRTDVFNKLSASRTCIWVGTFCMRIYSCASILFCFIQFFALKFFFSLNKIEWTLALNEI